MILRIYEEIYKRRRFTIPQIVEELMEEYGEIGRAYIKRMVRQAVVKLLREGIVRKVAEPSVFENLYPEGDEEEVERRCETCGKKFVPKRGSQDRYCSRRCYEKAKARRRRKDTRKRVRKYLHSADKKAENRGKPWSSAEDLLLKELLSSGKTHREIAERLGRTVYSVRWRVQKLGLVGGKR